MRRRLIFPVLAFIALVVTSIVSTPDARAQGSNCNYMVCTVGGCAYASSPPNPYCWSYMGTCGWDWCDDDGGGDPGDPTG